MPLFDKWVLATHCPPARPSAPAQTYFGTKSQTDEQVVLLSTVLASDATLGYEATLGEGMRGWMVRIVS